MKPLSAREILAGTVDAVPVIYRGIQMRSKLEAEFAWLLDERGLVWQYEPRIYRSDMEPGYIPDFMVNERGDRCYVEVKPTFKQAKAARERMKAIWTVDPEALLVIVSGDGWWQATAPGRDNWETWQEHWHRSFPKRGEAA